MRIFVNTQLQIEKLIITHRLYVYNNSITVSVYMYNNKLSKTGYLHLVRIKLLIPELIKIISWVIKKANMYYLYNYMYAK